MKLVNAEEEFILFLAEFYPSWQRLMYHVTRWNSSKIQSVIIKQRYKQHPDLYIKHY